MIAEENTINDPVLQWVTYLLDGEVYGINVMQVQEILRPCEIVPVPGAPDYVIGIINLRGNMATIIDTRKRFGLKSADLDEQSRIIIVEVADGVVGMMVDSVAEVVYLHQSEIDTTPSVAIDDSSRFIQGVCSRSNGLLILVDDSRLLAEDEIAEFSSIQDR